MAEAAEEAVKAERDAGRWNDMKSGASRRAFACVNNLETALLALRRAAGGDQ